MKEILNKKKNIFLLFFISLVSIFTLILPVFTAPPTLSINLTGNTDVEAGNPSSYQYTLTITNPSATDTATNVVLKTTLPANYTFSSTTSFTKGLTPVTHNFTNSSGSLTWTPTSSLNLAPGQSAQVIFNVLIGCNATRGIMQGRADYIDAQLPIGLSDFVTRNLDITVKKGVLVFEKTPTVQNASKGDIVTWTVKTRNTGLATIYNVSVTDIVGSGLNNIIVTPDLPTPTLNLVGNTITTNYTSIAAGDFRSFTVSGTINSCTNLSNSVSGTWSCNTANADANIAFVPKAPNIDFTINGVQPPNNVPIDWANGSNVTVVVSNSGIGPANSFIFDTTLNNFPLSVSNVSAGWSYSSITGAFNYTAGTPLGTILPGGSATLTFKITLANACSSSALGSVNWNPQYTDECGIIYSPPVSISTLSVASVPTIGITKISSMPIVTSNQAFSYTITPTITQDSYFNGNITVTDLVPSIFTVNSVSATVGTASHTGQNVTWTLLPSQVNGASMTINVTTSGQNCLAGGTHPNTVNISGTTGPSPLSICTFTANSTANVSIASFVPGVITMTKAIDPAITTPAEDPGLGFEVCNATVGFVNEISLTGTSNGTFAGSELIENLDNGQTYISNSVEYDFDSGSGYSGSYTAVPPVRILSTTPTLRVDLGFLTDPVQNKKVKIRYRLNENSIGQFNSRTNVHLNASADGCVPASTNYTDLTALRAMNITQPTMGISITAPSVQDDCQTFPVTLNISKNAWLARNNVTVTFDTTNYSYLGSPIYTGFAGLTPTVGTSGSNQTFSFGTNNITAGGTITFNVKKKCGNPFVMSSGLSWKNNCGTTLNTSANYSPILTRVGLLNVDVSPSAIYTPDENVSWFIYITNSGTGSTYDVTLNDAIGSNLRFLNNTGSVLPSGSTFTSQPTINTDGATTLTWTIDKIDPGKTAVIKVNAKLIGLCGNNLGSTVSANWCSGTSCQTVAPINKPVITVPSSSAVTTIEKVTPLKLCSSSTIRTIIKNSGQTNIYNLLSNTTIPNGMCYVANTAKIKINNGAFTTFSPNVAGQVITWQYGIGNPNNILNSLVPGDTATIEYDVKGTCGMEVNDIVSSQTFFAKPCEIDFRGGVGTGSTGTTSSTGQLGMQTLLPSITTNLSPSLHTASSGQNITWTYTATNTSTQVDAQNVKFKFTLPSNVNYNAGTTTPLPSSISGQDLFYDLSDLLANGGNTSLTIGGTVAINACTSSDTTANTELTFGCNAGSSCTGASCSANTISRINSVSLRTRPSVANVNFPTTSMDSCGTSGHFFINFQNTGTTATDFQVQDTLPLGLLFDSAFTPVITATNGGSFILASSPTNGSATPTWSFSTLAKGDYTIEFKVKAGASGTCFNTSSNNSIAISYKDSCNNSYNEPATNTAITVLKPIVSLANARNFVNYVTSPTTTPQFDKKAIITDGGNITFEIKFRNTGNYQLTNFSVTDVVGTSFKNDATLVFNNGSGGEVPSINLGTRTASWTISSLALGAEWTTTINAQHLGSNDTSGLTNNVTFDGGCGTGCKFESTLGTLPYSQIANVALLDTFTKTMSKTTATIGENVPITLTATLSGTGTNFYQNVIIRDLLPKDASNNPMMLINGTPTLLDTAGNTWTYTAPTAPNWIATWIPATPATFATPTTITININGYINDVTPSSSGVKLGAAATNPTRGTVLTNSADISFDSGGQSYTRAQTPAPALTIQEPSLSFSKARVALTNVQTGSVATIAQGTTVVGGGQLVGYRIDITNDNDTNCSTAYDVKLLDIISHGMRVTNPTIITTGVVLTNLTTSANTTITSGQISNTFNNSTGNWNLEFLKTNGFTGIPKNHRLRIDYFTTIDNDVSPNRINSGGDHRISNSLYLARTTAGTGAGNEGYSSLPSDDVNNNFDRKYANVTASILRLTTPNVGILKAVTTNVNESGNDQTTKATPGETVTYKIIFGTANITTGLFPVGYGTPLGTSANNTNNLNITANATTATTAAPLSAVQPISSFLDVIPDGLEVDTTASNIVVTSGTTSIPPTLSFSVNTPSTGRTMISSNDFTINPNTVITATIVTKLRKTFASTSLNIPIGTTLSNGGNTATNYTRFRYQRVATTTTNTEAASGTISITEVEPNIPSITKTKVSPAQNSVQPGDTITYRLTFTTDNTNNSVAHNVIVTDIIPEGMRGSPPIFVSETPTITQDTIPSITFPNNPITLAEDIPLTSYKYYNPNNGQLTWLFDKLNPGTAVTIDYSIKAVGCGIKVNNAKLTSYNNLINGINNTGRKSYGPLTAPAITINSLDMGLIPNQSMGAAPGDVVIMPHVLSACNTGVVNFSTTTNKGWVYTVHQDLSANHDGSLIGPPITSISATAGTPLYLAVKVSIPHNETDGSVDNVKITATQTVGGVSHTAFADDIITVISSTRGLLKLTKAVDKATATPGEVLTYTITFNNIGATNLSNIVIKDMTPESSTFVSAGVTAPFTGTITNPIVGAKGEISWTLNESVKPGESGTVTFSVTVE